MNSSPTNSPPNPDLALDALERAVEVTETGVTSRPIVLVSPADIASLPAADLRNLLDRIVMGQDPDAGLDSMLASGVIDVLFPELKALVGFGDGEWRHKDVWKHTKQVVCQAVPRLEVRWAALFHDVGKVKTRSISSSGEVHFFGHAEVGARMFDKLDRRTQLFSDEPALKQSVRFLVLNHLRASQYEKSWTDSAVRRFAKEIGDEIDNLLCLSRADITTKRPEKRRRGVSLINELEIRILDVKERDAVVPKLPSGVGDDLMAEFKLPPSRLIGDIKRALEAAVDSGEIEGYRESLYYVNYIAEHRERFGLPGL